MRWTPEMDDKLRELYEEHSRAEIRKIMGLREGQLRARLSRLGLNGKVNPWTEEEIDALKSAYEDAEYSEDICLVELSKKLGRHKSNVCRKARSLGLTDNRREGIREKKIRKRKYLTDAERNAAQSRRQTKWLQENEHPRGMAGKNHSEQTKKVLSECTRQREADLDEDEKARRTLKGLKKKAENGTLVNNNVRGSWKAGWRIIGEKKNYYRSMWEANYARYLQWLKDRREILDWEHEPKTFWFEEIKRGTRSYLPDFWVKEKDGTEAYHEVKGWMDDRSKTKIKRMAKYHPDVSLKVIQAKEYKAIKAQMMPFIKDWEVDAKGR